MGKFDSKVEKLIVSPFPSNIYLTKFSDQSIPLLGSVDAKTTNWDNSWVLQL